ncbi:MAG TPA: DUF3311 domain-containing protein [Rhizomicrobium sp.]|nr:DUF3311 domain-containing protein [Rhizomicrobium sp.]
MSPALRLTIGLVVPFLMVVPTVPLLGHLHVAPFGVPLALWWLFGCIPLASLCLAICWFAHDRHQPDEFIEADYDSGERP